MSNAPGIPLGYPWIGCVPAPGDEYVLETVADWPHCALDIITHRRTKSLAITLKLFHRGTSRACARSSGACADGAKAGVKVHRRSARTPTRRPACLRGPCQPTPGHRSLGPKSYDGTDGTPDALGGRFDLAVPDVSVAQSHTHTAVTKQARDDRQGHAVQRRLTRYCVAQVMKTHIFDPGLPADPVPESGLARGATGRVPGRRKAQFPNRMHDLSIALARHVRGEALSSSTCWNHRR